MLKVVVAPEQIVMGSRPRVRDLTGSLALLKSREDVSPASTGDPSMVDLGTTAAFVAGDPGSAPEDRPVSISRTV